ncbi:MAG: fibronectin type III domain-containing protein, partial [Cryobacterium sp.]
IRVTVDDRSQIIPFAVSHPDDPGIVSYAFIWVPGFDDALPQARRGAPKLTIESESKLTIDIADYVVAVGGNTVKLTDRTAVQATHADGAPLVVTDRQLVFTSADKYYGPASISFEVTDGSGVTGRDGATGRTATIVLPITVTPRANQPPSFDGAIIDVEPDETRVIDLRKLTTYPYPDDRDELAYTVLEPKPRGFSYTIDGPMLTLRASPSTAKGSSSAMTIGVRDDLSAGKAGRIEMRVVGSTRPIAVPAADAAIAPRGQTTVVDVLANDGATNPFPATPLIVVGVRGLERGALPAGVSITRSADNRRLSVTVSAAAEPADTNLEYQVADATNDPDRYAWGTVRISVQDKADPVTNLRVTGYGDKKLAVSFNAGAANNSPITGYEVTLLDAGSGAPLSTVACQATACDVATPGNGQGNGVRVAVAARNGLGLSAATALAAPVWSDVVPSAPTGLAAAPLDGGLRLSWNAVGTTGGGTAVRGYVVTVGGTPQGEVSASGPRCGATSCSIDVIGLSNGADVSYTVSARNQAFPALSTWNDSAATGRPFGPARAGGISATGSDATGSVVVAWDPFDGKGDPIAGYYVQRLSSDIVPTGAQACSVSAPAPGLVNPAQAGGAVAEQVAVSAGTRSVVFDNLLASNATYNFVVWGYNRAGCAATAVATVRVRPAPDAITNVTWKMEQRLDAWDAHITSVAPQAGVDHYNVRAADGSGPIARFDRQGWPRELLGRPFGETVAVQVQACAAWGICGAWSGPKSAPEKSVSFAVAGVAYNEVAGQYSWTGDPQNGPDLPASYQCSVPGDPTVPVTVADSPNTCTLPSPAPPTGTVRLTVTVNGHSYNYNN